jgi:cytochrome c peroxidase
MHLYEKWLAPEVAQRAPWKASVARGEQLFFRRQFVIEAVEGFNDELGQPRVLGTCATCHNMPNVGSRSTSGLMNIDTSSVSELRPPYPGLPIYTFQCGDDAQNRFQTTDPGRALKTGRCQDTGKFKVPGLRGLAARPPYFHDGWANTLEEVVGYHDRRFGIRLSPQEGQDLVMFLRSL